jgi:hypothetical protein
MKTRKSPQAVSIESPIFLSHNSSNRKTTPSSSKTGTRQPTSIFPGFEISANMRGRKVIQQGHHGLDGFSILPSSLLADSCGLVAFIQKQSFFDVL